MQWDLWFFLGWTMATHCLVVCLLLILSACKSFKIALRVLSIYQVSKRTSATPLIRELHWLPIQGRIEFKVLVHVYYCVGLNGSSPIYLQNLLSFYNSGHQGLKSSKDLTRLTTPITKRSFGDRSFAVLGPRLWSIFATCSWSSVHFKWSTFDLEFSSRLLWFRPNLQKADNLPCLIEVITLRAGDAIYLLSVIYLCIQLLSNIGLIIAIIGDVCNASLTAHNWQKWKRVFLTCPCHKIYMAEAVGLKTSNYNWKIMIFMNM